MKFKRFNLYWSPEGRRIADMVIAPSANGAIQLAPFPYRRYRGEIYAVELEQQPSGAWVEKR